jgi:hypothetical protein
LTALTSIKKGDRKMNEKQLKIYEELSGLDGETVIRLLTNYHGLQILDDGFYDFLIDQDIIEEDEEDEDEEEKIIDVEMAGNVEYNGMNCRNRTAFVDDLGRCIYFEFDAGHTNIKGNKQGDVWFHISYLFRIDIEKDKNANYTQEMQELADTINKQKRPYTIETLNTVLNEIGLTNHVVAFRDGYAQDPAYRVHNEYGTYNFGN